jgi:TPR repeat protein
LYRKAADQGDAMAQHNLGYCLRNGVGVEQDLAESVSWYRKAAEHEISAAPAQLMLGYCYRYGEGVDQDFVEAARWSRKAAELDD